MHTLYSPQEFAANVTAKLLLVMGFTVFTGWGGGKAFNSDGCGEY
jgi:hypothetical protein